MSEKIEMPLLSVIARMEQRGVMIDSKFLQKLSKQFATRIKELEDQAYQLSDEVFNLNSPNQLQSLLFEPFTIPLKRICSYCSDIAEVRINSHVYKTSLDIERNS